MENELWEYLKTAEKAIVLYGMGNGADKIIAVLEAKGIRYEGVFASDGFVRNKTFHGHKICTLKELEEKYGEMIILLCFGSERPEVIEYIKNIAARHELYAPDVAVTGGGLFDREFLQKNKSRLEKIYSLLTDDISRKTFSNIINFKLSGKIKYLFDCSVTKNEPYQSFLKLSDKEHFLDLGAYNGDTVAEFISRTTAYSQITAVEPDIKSFKKLTKNTTGIDNICLLNAAISDFTGKGNFGMMGGRNSSVAEKGVETVFLTVDSISGNNPPTFIKMDLEGEEISAIRGSAQAILKHKPKMLISAYHRTDDLLTIPEEVLSIRKDYKLYIRHFSALPAWDINYYFI